MPNRSPVPPSAGIPPGRMILSALFAALVGGVAGAFEAGMPNPPASPTRVRCGVVVLDIIDIDDVNESFEAELLVMASWHDPRLSFDPVEEGTDRKIFQGAFQFAEVFHGWWPQLLIVNQAGRGDSSAVTLTVFPDGLVRYAEQLNARLETPMQLHDFPFDSQRLRALMVPFGNPIDEVVFEVESDLTDTTNEYVRREQHVNVAGWSLESLEMTVDEASLLRGGREQRFSRLVTTINLQRRSWQLVWQMLFPMLVIVSMIWSIFWIDSDSLADRLNVSFIGVLTIVAYQFVVIEHMPRMSYLTFTDSLLLASFVAMAATIPQSLFIHRLVRRGENGRAERVDRTCRWAFPLGYLMLVGGTAVWYWVR
jgi:hypothetical protein